MVRIYIIDTAKETEKDPSAHDMEVEPQTPVSDDAAANGAKRKRDGACNTLEMYRIVKPFKNFWMNIKC